MQYLGFYPSPLGRIVLASDGEAVTGLWFEGQKYFAAGLDPAHEARPLPVFAQTARWLDCYFSGREPDFLPPLAPQGTPFRQEVWVLLRQIPYGSTTTYRALAETLARRRGTAALAAQAVGGAVGHNPVSILIPCHRVIGSDGSLTGYAAGLAVKRALLALERDGRLTAPHKEA